jgi:hypothetical protein
MVTKNPVTHQSTIKDLRPHPAAFASSYCRVISTGTSTVAMAWGSPCSRSPGGPDWIEGFGEKGINGEEGALRFDMAVVAVDGDEGSDGSGVVW